MNLINCDACESLISANAGLCPHCGEPHTKPFTLRVAIFTGLLITALLINYAVVDI